MNESPDTYEQTSPEALAEALSFAEDTAKQAGALTLSEREAALKIERKNGETSNIVTNGDRASEECIVNALREHFPDDAIRGEEGSSVGGLGREWIIDPIDGTYNYSRGKPYSVSIGLVENGESILGVLHFPDTNVMLSATNGGGLQIHGKKSSRKSVAELAKAKIGFDVSSGGNEADEITTFHDPLSKQAASVERIWCCTEAARRIVMGELSGYICGGGLTPFDLAAVTVILKEAGCTIEGIDDPIDFSKPKNPVIMATDTDVLKSIRKLIKP